MNPDGGEPRITYSPGRSPLNTKSGFSGEVLTEGTPSQGSPVAGSADIRTEGSALPELGLVLPSNRTRPRSDAVGFSASSRCVTSVDPTVTAVAPQSSAQLDVPVTEYAVPSEAASIPPPPRITSLAPGITGGRESYRSNRAERLLSDTILPPPWSM